MSFNGTVEEEFNKLTAAQQDSIFELIILFNQSNSQGGGTAGKKNNKVPYNTFSGGLKYIAPDFDEIPEGFEEYV